MQMLTAFRERMRAQMLAFDAQRKWDLKDGVTDLAERLAQQRQKVKDPEAKLWLDVAEAWLHQASERYDEAVEALAQAEERLQQSGVRNEDVSLRLRFSRLSILAYSVAMSPQPQESMLSHCLLRLLDMPQDEREMQAKIRGSLALGHLRLGKENEAAELMVSAIQLDPAQLGRELDAADKTKVLDATMQWCWRMLLLSAALKAGNVKPQALEPLAPQYEAMLKDIMREAFPIRDKQGPVDESGPPQPKSHPAGKPTPTMRPRM